MKQTSETILFFGNERLATGVSTDAPTLRALIEAGYNIAAVISNYEHGTSRNARKLEIAEIAEKHGIPLLLPKKLLDITDQISSYGAAAAVLVAYGRIIPEEIINIFPMGIINIHPSLLPKHRGPTPIESVILSGESTTGVSLMKLAKEMDAGPIYSYSAVSLNGHETKQDLADSLLDLGKAMLIELLPGILNGSVVAEAQNHDQATFDSLIDKSAGEIVWEKPALQLEREIRAFSNWPKSRTNLNGLDIIVTQAAAVKEAEGSAGSYETTGKSLRVFCGEGALDILTLQPAGKKEMPIQAFLAGYTV